MDATTSELGWRELLATMDENTGTEAQRVEVIRLRGEYAQDMARLERRRQAEQAKTDPRSEETPGA